MKQERTPRDLRYRDRCFPGAAEEVLEPKKGGFVPLPIITRKLLKHMTDAELRVWIYLQTRASQWFVCYPTYQEILSESGVRSKGTISKGVHGLERKGFIRSYNDRGVRRYLVRNPRLAAMKLFELGELAIEEFEEVNDLLEQLRQPILEQPVRKPQALSLPTKVKSMFGS